MKVRWTRIETAISNLAKEKKKRRERVGRRLILFKCLWNNIKDRGKGGRGGGGKIFFGWYGQIIIMVIK